MKIYEYQAKQLFQAYGITVPKGVLANSPQGAVEAARTIGTTPLVIKAQLHAGGRGKAGGIRVVDRPEDVQNIASLLLSKKLVTSQTGPEGKMVNALLVEETVKGDRELYIGLTIDRDRACIAILASAEGGVDIEQMAQETPEKLLRDWVDPGVGLCPFQVSRLSYALGLNKDGVKQLSPIITGVYRLLIEKDCSHVEINPLLLTAEGKLVALDAKINFDDNALYRHPDVSSLRDSSQEEPLEVEASRYKLNYIKLNGNVGCMVNGAGLAMATMDLIKLIGAAPANFLDVGGGASAEMVREALRILISDHDVKVVFINIFGGILRCDTLAKGVTEAAREFDIKTPVVVRLEGTNVEMGRTILAASGLHFRSAGSMKEAAEMLSTLLEGRG
ncbi:MAG TPA: ADP-forming succinate--CoA ligase subunit beta [Syntrophorhabdales bacterium]|nr:ADP-forming succinate--CoA ligase subunit beta [Syntrophorhabdales bacterium]